jgi:hypothetical protein
MNYDSEILRRLRLARLDDEWARGQRRAMFWTNVKGWIVPAVSWGCALFALWKVIRA